MNSAACVYFALIRFLVGEIALFHGVVLGENNVPFEDQIESLFFVVVAWIVASPRTDEDFDASDVEEAVFSVVC